MSMSIINRVKAALADTLKLQSIESISDEARLKEDLGLDSMLSLTFLMALEDNIEGFIVDAETLEADDLQSVSTISLYVSQQLRSEVTYA